MIASSMLRFRSVLLAACLLLLLAATVAALPVTLPSNLPAYTATGTLTGGVGYYYTNLSAWMAPGLTRSYHLVFDAEGDIVFFRTAPIIQHGNWSTNDHVQRHLFSMGGTNRPDYIVIEDYAFTALDTLPKLHPIHGGPVKLDGHEMIYDDDGNLWTLWRDPREIDMSQYVPGGLEDAVVIGHLIERWNDDDEITWSWASLDHIDDFPFTACDDTSSLTGTYWEHLHINAFQLTHEGDLLISPRRYSIASLIDTTTGSAIWHLGSGALNQFTFTGDVPPDTPLDFTDQHDARMLEDGTVTVFDNGMLHDDPRAYAREYTLDTDAMTAELSWLYAYEDEPFEAEQLGGFRRDSNDNRIICWGGKFHPVQYTLVNPGGEVIWDLVFPSGPDHAIPAGYRMEHSLVRPVAARPMATGLLHMDLQEIEVVGNWFGHVDEVAAYEVYLGTDDWWPELIGSTDTGMMMAPFPDDTSGVAVRVRALDGNGDPISPISEPWLRGEFSGLAHLVGTVTHALYGDPVEGAEIRVGRGIAWTDAAGHYELKGIHPDAATTMTISHPDFPDFEQTIAMVAGPQTVDAALDPNLADVDLTLHGDGIIPATGGTLTYDVRVEHNGTTPFWGHAWSMATGPGGDTVGPLFLVYRQFTPGLHEAFDLELDVPGFVPGGEYEFIVRVGLFYQNLIGAQDSFTFEKLPAGAQVGSLAEALNEEALRASAPNWRAESAAAGSGATAELPAEFGISAVRPNPFNPTAAVTVSLPRAGDLNVRVIDILGRTVTTLADEHRMAGTHTLAIDGTEWASGVYFLAVDAGAEHAVRKLVLVK